MIRSVCSDDRLSATGPKQLKLCTMLLIPFTAANQCSAYKCYGALDRCTFLMPQKKKLRNDRVDHKQTPNAAHSVVCARHFASTTELSLDEWGWCLGKGVAKCKCLACMRGCFSERRIVGIYGVVGRHTSI